MKLLECYFCDGLGWIELEDAVDTFSGELHIEEDCQVLPSIVSFYQQMDYFNCPDCLGRGWESPWKNR